MFVQGFERRIALTVILEIGPVDHDKVPDVGQEGVSPGSTDTHTLGEITLLKESGYRMPQLEVIHGAFDFGHV
jgi:hypothetical protein